MASKHVGADMNYAWPTAQIAVMGAKGAVEIIFRQDIADPEPIASQVKQYEDRFLSPFVAAERGYIDEVIEPSATRPRIARALAMLRSKSVDAPRRKHDNIRSERGSAASERGRRPSVGRPDRADQRRLRSQAVVSARSAWVKPCPAGIVRCVTPRPGTARIAARRSAFSAGMIGSIAPERIRTGLPSSAGAGSGSNGVMARRSTAPARTSGSEQKQGGGDVGAV